MALSNVTIIKGQGGLGRTAAGEDYISGMLIYDDDLPTGFTSSEREKQVFSLEDAEDLGILTDYADGTVATGAGFTVTAVGADGDTISVNIDTPLAGSLGLGTYTKVAADTTVDAVGAGVAAAINLGTNQHGFTAVNTSGVIVITAPERYGVFLNTTGVTTVISGTITVGTPTNFSGGTYSKLAQYHYYISEYFRINPNGNLFVGFYDVPASYTFTEVSTLQTFAGGKIRQMAVITPRTEAYADTMVDTLQTVYDSLYASYQPCELFLAPEFGSTTIAAIADLSGKTSEDVSVCSACDNNGQGAFLRLTSDTTVGAIGAMLGAVSRASVDENIAWVAQYDMSNGIELESIGFLKGIPYASVSTNAQTALENKRYIFLRKFIGLSGSYWNDDVTATSASSDYSNIRLNRAIDKAVRLVRVAMLPRLNQPILVNSDGTLPGDLIDDFSTTAKTPLNQMETDEEISASQVLIDPNQNVLATSTLVITVKIVPVGSAKFITVKIGFTAQI